MNLQSPHVPAVRLHVVERIGGASSRSVPQDHLSRDMLPNESPIDTLSGLIAMLCALVLVAGCGEAMQFENAGSKHAFMEDQQACDQELQTPAWAHYVNEAKGQVDPWQICIEHKGWKRMDRPAPPAAGVKSSMHWIRSRLNSRAG